MNEIKKKLLNQLEKHMEADNKKKLYFNFKKGDLILKRNFDPDKVTSRFKGPYTVIQHSKLRNYLVIEEGNKVCKVSVKNVKPFKAREGCELACQSHIIGSSRIRNEENDSRV
ncbi:hypothetical protein DMUE_2467 [Dictyocoela muelleri]|nr:hypothetical protein DMUE_2467 [Dictyocoela muelleri]